MQDKYCVVVVAVHVGCCLLLLVVVVVVCCYCCCFVVALVLVVVLACSLFGLLLLSFNPKGKRVVRPTSVGGGSRRMLPPRQSLVPRAVLEHQTGRAGYASKNIFTYGDSLKMFIRYPS